MQSEGWGGDIQLRDGRAEIATHFDFHLNRAKGPVLFLAAFGMGISPWKHKGGREHGGFCLVIPDQKK